MPSTALYEYNMSYKHLIILFLLLSGVVFASSRTELQSQIAQQRQELAELSAKEGDIVLMLDGISRRADLPGA